VIGVRKTLNDTSGNTIFDLVAQTSGPISITGNLLGVRTVAAGTLVVFYNTAQYTATFSPVNLVYSDPTCGSETFSMNGEIDTIQLAGCE
jgi:hypothetical protein